MLNQKLKEMEKMFEDYKHVCYENDAADIIKNESFDILNEANNLTNLNKHAKHYSDIYIAISSIAYIFGSKSYNFLRKYFLLPHKSLIRKNISPDVSSNVEKFTNIDKCGNI